ncbi:hypothetical protein AS361_01490 [Myroides marinus]|uniref:nSTAND3 domain-containing NTPase n=1 Tax=Myroides marinus TaxID=703342 RepID=UPI0007423905|nr:ATP-binding protein [Myroides marinus]KUF41715.1 hypothetical protein AS361_01490 [Myroides marinus]
MNTIPQIENALKTINQAKFQILVNHLLYLQGHNYIGAPGAVIGKEKTSKGTPDSFYFENGKYIFVECTTQEKLGKSKLFINKLLSDIDHCFNQKQTTISKEKIEKIILACTEKVSPKEFQQLQEKVKSYNNNTEFELINIQNLPKKLFDFPQLINEYFEIEIIKGEIYTLQEFLLKTKKGLQPSLINEFIGRENELQDSLKALEKYDILFLSGSAGVGKSKLAVKILEELSKDNYTPIVIQSSEVSLWDDYQKLFQAGQQYIILFDDANKSIQNLIYILSKIVSPKSYTAKIIITSRDYVKKEISKLLDNNYSYKEFNISEFNDEDINKIICAAQPQLNYHSNIKRKIVELAKGNARVALMATYSVTVESEINYLNNPVLLYEKYFNKIAYELEIFKKPIILQSLAIVSFFGRINKNNTELKEILSTQFNIDWDELWLAIIELHDNEILDLYANEIVKVSDQVLATYAFYKCFIDHENSVINYDKWIIAFMEKYEHRISLTLIDVNNTFEYRHIKELVLPHLNQIIINLKSDLELYLFYNVFWFYKKENCLLYLKDWITNLNQEQIPETFNFHYTTNNHTIATNKFNLLKGFWNHPDELLKISIELTFELLNKEPSRLPEVLKFLIDDFKYKIEDTENAYFRQNKLLDILLSNEINETQKKLADGIFHHIAEILIGWHQTVIESRGNSLRFYNFSLYKSEDLLKLRARILNQVYNLASFDNDKILNKIVYPRGKMDKSIYLDELPIYNKIISDRLDKTQYAHCKFVSLLANHLTDIESKYPEYWNEFINSDIKKLSSFLEPNLESQKEKEQEFNDFVQTNNWQNLEDFLLKVNSLYSQQKNTKVWHIEQAVNEIFLCIARKNKFELEQALRLFFSGRVSFTLHISIIHIIFHENIMTAKELLSIMNDYEFKGKTYWESVLLAMIPEEQVNTFFLELLLRNFQRLDEYSYVSVMLDYVKYSTVFEQYKKGNTELKKHNVITYLTSILLTKTNKTEHILGSEFCANCASYFTKHSQLLKDAYWIQYRSESYYDFNNTELKTMMDFDRDFIKQSIKNDIIGLDFTKQLELKNINLEILWDYDEYQIIIEEIILIILDKKDPFDTAKENIISLFQLENATNERVERIKDLILKLTKKYSENENIILIFIKLIHGNYQEWFMEYFKAFLISNKNIKMIQRVNFDITETNYGSWVPVYEKEIKFFEDLIEMIKTLPNFLDYYQHISYYEERIICKKREIQQELKKDFIED